MRHLLFSFLAIAILFASGCSEKVEKSPKKSSDSKNVMAKQKGAGSNCESDCWLSSCKTECPGDGAECACFFGWANCDCDNSSVAVSQDEIQIAAVDDFTGFVDTGLSTEQNRDQIESHLVNIQSAVDNENWNTYDSLLTEYKTDMENLPSEAKNSIDNWCQSNNYPKLFD